MATVEGEDDSKKRPAPTEEPSSSEGAAGTGATTTTPTATTSSGRASKRERKSVDRMVPNNFVERSATVPVIDGRGQALKDIPVVFQHIDTINPNSAEITEAFRFLFHRGKVAQAAKKAALLDFNGYLERIPEEEDDKKSETKKGDKEADEAAATAKKQKQDKLDEDAETKMSRKAYKMKISELKKLCDFFRVDRSSKDGESVTKDVLVDRLLDFLSEPDESQCVKPKGGVSKSSGGKKAATGKKAKSPASKKSSSKSKKSSKKEESDNDEGDEEGEAPDDSEDDGGNDGDSKDKKTPSDKALRKWVKAYVACFNLDKATTKHAMATASEKFGVDLSEKKRVIKKMLTEEM